MNPDNQGRYKPQLVLGTLMVALLGLVLWGAHQGDPTPPPNAPAAQSEAPPGELEAPQDPAPPAPAVLARAKPKVSLGRLSDTLGQVQITYIEQGGHRLPVAAQHITARVQAHSPALDRWLAQQGSRRLGQSPWTGRVRLAVPLNMPPDAFAQLLAQHPAISDARPDPIAFATGKGGPRRSTTLSTSSLSTTSDSTSDSAAADTSTQQTLQETGDALREAAQSDTNAEHGLTITTEPMSDEEKLALLNNGELVDLKQTGVGAAMDEASHLLPYQWHLESSRTRAMWLQHYDPAISHCSTLHNLYNDCIDGCPAGINYIVSSKKEIQCLETRYQQSLPSEDWRVRVAVLDSGVAYMDQPSTSPPTVQAPDLAQSNLVPGYDFINDDAEPLDDNQHGTHMATVAMGMGRTRGAVWAAELMPVKVLDGEKAGTESALVDGLHYAIDHGADVVNMSLSFPRGYLPGQAMEEVVLKAQEKGVVLVAAAGNDGQDFVSYPAAFPQVIAVGAYSLDPATGLPQLAPYSNHSAALDVLAPGGRLDVDANRDGLPDGILGQTFPWQDPSQQGYWLLAGTSPATAQVTGVVAALLEAGVDPRQARWLLTAHADRLEDHDARLHGNGLLNAEATLAAVFNPGEPEHQYSVNAAVVLAQGPELQRRGWAALEIIDEENHPAPGLTVHGHWMGDVLGLASCTTDAHGYCHVPSPRTEQGQVFAFQVDGVEDDMRQLYRPVSFHRFDELTYRLLATLSEADARNVAFSYQGEVLDQFSIPDQLIPTVDLKNIGTGLASSSIVLGLEYNFFVSSSIAPSYLHLQSFGTGLASSSIVIDLNFFNTNLLASYSPSTMLVRSYSYGSGLASSSALFFGGAFYGFDALQMNYDPGVLYFNSGTGLASSSLVRDLSLWNSSLFTLTPSLDQSLIGYGTGLASSSFVLDMNLSTASWLGWSPSLFAFYGTGLASSSLVLQPTLDLQYSTLQTTSSWSGASLSLNFF